MSNKTCNNSIVHSSNWDLIYKQKLNLIVLRLKRICLNTAGDLEITADVAEQGPRARFSKVPKIFLIFSQVLPKFCLSQGVGKS